jgi:hypothetical protein
MPVTASPAAALEHRSLAPLKFALSTARNDQLTLDPRPTLLDAPASTCSSRLRRRALLNMAPAPS